MSSSSNPSLDGKITIHTWKIDNISSSNGLKSSPDLKHFGNIFYLRFYIKDEIKSLTNTSAIYLMRYLPFDEDISVSCQISILDSKKKKCFTKEFHVTYNTKNQSNPVHGGLYMINREYLLNPENSLVQNNSLSINCEIRTLNKNKNFQTKERESSLKISSDLNSLLESGQFSDVLFVIGNETKKEFRLHKNILGSRSTVFNAMFTNDCEEKRNNRVEITDMAVSVFEEMIRYIYTGKTDLGLGQYAEELFVASDKYQLDLLKNIAAQELSSKLSPESVSSILLLADMHNAEQLQTDCIKYISEHCDQVISSEAWKKLIETRLDLMVQLYRDLTVVAKAK